MGKVSKIKEYRKKLRELLSVMEVNDGDLIVVKANSDFHASMNELAQIMARTKRPNCIILAAEKLDEIRILNEEQMNELGWYKK